MGKISERVLCPTCPYLNNGIKEEGEKFNVEYVVLKAKEQYLICDNPDVPWDKIMKEIRLFDTTYVPKFGKYEIEQLVAIFIPSKLIYNLSFCIFTGLLKL